MTEQTAVAAESATNGVPGYRMISATRLGVSDRCSRQYFYRYIAWIPEEDRPILHFGRAVEDAILQVFETRPAIADTETITLEGLLRWAAELAASGVAPALLRAKEVWESNPNRSGDWAELDLARGQAMARQCFSSSFHGKEVERALPASGGDLLGAWALARPRHTHTQAEPFSGHQRIPPGDDAFFSGEFDLHYVHGGQSKIVDLKSANLGGIFGSKYSDQMLAYCWIHLEISGRMPDGIELWYLGEAAPVVLPLPSVDEVMEYAKRARVLFDMPERAEDEHLAEPAPIIGQDRDWCSVCSYTAICPRLRAATAPAPLAAAMPLSSASDDGKRVNVSGVIAAIKKPTDTRNGKRMQKLYLADSSGYREITLFDEAIDRHGADLKRGDRLKIENARVSFYRERPGLMLDRGAKVLPL